MTVSRTVCSVILIRTIEDLETTKTNEVAGERSVMQPGEDSRLFSPLSSVDIQNRQKHSDVRRGRTTQLLFWKQIETLKTNQRLLISYLQC